MIGSRKGCNIVSAVYSPISTTITLLRGPTRLGLHSPLPAGPGRFGGLAGLDWLNGLPQQSCQPLPHLIDIGRLPAMAAAGHADGAIGPDSMGDPSCQHVSMCL